MENFNTWRDEVAYMNRYFKGTAQDYLRLRAKKHQLSYNSPGGCKMLNALADGIDNLIAENARLKKQIASNNSQE